MPEEPSVWTDPEGFYRRRFPNGAKSIIELLGQITGSGIVSEEGEVVVADFHDQMKAHERDFDSLLDGLHELHKRHWVLLAQALDSLRAGPADDETRESYFLYLKHVHDAVVNLARERYGRYGHPIARRALFAKTHHLHPTYQQQLKPYKTPRKPHPPRGWGLDKPEH